MKSRALHHVALRCLDVTRTACFYEEVLGLLRARAQEDERGLRSVWLEAQGVVVMCERREADEPRAPANDAHVVAFAAEPQEWPMLIAALRAHDVAVEATTDFTVYFRDPDGRRVALSSYPHPRLTLNA